MAMVTPVPMRIAVVAPRVVSPIIVSTIVTVVAPAHDDHRGGSNHDRRRDTEADGDIHTGLRRLRLRKQYESQEWDCTPRAYDMGETFHSHILAL